MDLHAKLEALIEELIEAKREYQRLAFDREPRMKLGKPASQKQIEKIESKLGKPLPPSYRAFLELHNGWEGFDGDVHLLSAEDYDEDWVKKRVKTLGSLLGEYAEEDPFKAGAIPIALGEDERTFTFLDPRKVRKTGEMDFVTLDLTQEQDRFKDFVAFLKDDLAVTQELIDEEKHGAPDEEEDEDED